MATLVTLKTETTLQQLTERIYGKLDAKERVRAESALIAANPHLTEEAAFRPGALVAVPPVSGLKPRPAATSSHDAVSDFQDAVAGGVAEYQKRLAANLDAAGADLEAQIALLKDREVVAALKRDNGGDLAKQLAESLKARAKSIAEDRKRQELLFKQIGEDLQRLNQS